MYKIIEEPKYAWSVEIAPEIFWYREEGQQPNVFHRMMQEMFFGFKWRKIDQ